MEIRLAVKQDENAIQKIYAEAREYMKKEGNPDQWGENHPLPDLIKKDIARGCLYAMEEQGAIHAVFALTHFDPCYGDKETKWKRNEPYAVIHSLAGDGKIKGVFDKAVAFALSRCSYIRIDTYKDNKTMLKELASHGFSPAGYCHQPDGTVRLCFEFYKK